MKQKFVDFNDESIPIGKRKQAYVKWAMKKGTSLMQAQRQANNKFGFEEPKKKSMCVMFYFSPFPDYYNSRGRRATELNMFKENIQRKMRSKGFSVRFIHILKSEDSEEFRKNIKEEIKKEYGNFDKVFFEFFAE